MNYKTVLLSIEDKVGTITLNRPQYNNTFDIEMARELNKALREFDKDINVNVVCPLAWTSQLEQFEKAYPEAFKANVHMPPMGRYGNSEYDIGRVCVQLASPDFKFMSGETITLEGGMGLRP